MAELRDLVDDVLGDALLQRVMPEAIRRIRAHRAAGHKTILITGTVDVFVRPLADLFDEVVASRMHTRDGVLTGYLDSPPLVDEARAAWLRRHAADDGPRPRRLLRVRRQLLRPAAAGGGGQPRRGQPRPVAVPARQT